MITFRDSLPLFLHIFLSLPSHGGLHLQIWLSVIIVMTAAESSCIHCLPLMCWALLSTLIYCYLSFNPYKNSEAATVTQILQNDLSTGLIYWNNCSYFCLFCSCFLVANDEWVTGAKTLKFFLSCCASVLIFSGHGALTPGWHSLVFNSSYVSFLGCSLSQVLELLPLPGQGSAKSSIPYPVFPDHVKSLTEGLGFSCSEPVVVFTCESVGPSSEPIFMSALHVSGAFIRAVKFSGGVCLISVCD